MRIKCYLERLLNLIVRVVDRFVGEVSNGAVGPDRVA